MFSFNKNFRSIVVSVVVVGSCSGLAVMNSDSAFAKDIHSSVSTNAMTANNFTSATVSANSSSKTLSGLPWKSGAFSMENGSLGDSFAKQRKAALDTWGTFADASSKSAMSSTWWLLDVPSSFKGNALSIGVPLYSKDSSAHDAAIGGMDQAWLSIAKGLASKYPASYVRIGWEMNLDGNGGAATESNYKDWIKAFQRASKIFKSVSPQFKIVFNPNIGEANGTGPDGSKIVNANVVYPGDNYVDVIGVDAYDQYSAYINDNSWNYHYAGKFGLNYWMQMSYLHNKKFALPEWGLMHHGDPVNDGGDNPKFIDYIFAYLQANANNIEYESYYDDLGSELGCGLSPDVNSNSMNEYNYWIGKLQSL